MMSNDELRRLLDTADNRNVNKLVAISENSIKHKIETRNSNIVLTEIWFRHEGY